MMNLQLVKEFNIPNSKMTFVYYDPAVSMHITESAKMFLDNAISELRDRYGIDLCDMDFSSIINYASNDAK